MNYIKNTLLVGLLAIMSFQGVSADSPIEECEVNAGAVVYSEVILVTEKDAGDSREVIFSEEGAYSCDFETLTRFAKINDEEYIVSPNWSDKVYRLNISNKELKSLEPEGLSSSGAVTLYHEPAFLEMTAEHLLLADQEPYGSRADMFYIYNTKDNEIISRIGAQRGFESGEKEVPVAVTSDGKYLISIETFKSLDEETIKWSVYDNHSIVGDPVFSYKTKEGEQFQQRSYPGSGSVVLSPNQRYVIDIATPTYYHNDGVSEFVIIDLESMSLVNFPYDQIPSEQKLFSKLGSSNNEFFFTSSPSTTQSTDDVYGFNLKDKNIRNISGSERGEILEKYDREKSYVSQNQYITSSYKVLGKESSLTPKKESKEEGIPPKENIILKFLRSILKLF